MTLNGAGNWTERAAKAVLLIRILVGWVFVSEGIQKFLFPQALGVGRMGLRTRLAVIPLFGVIVVALYTTKISMISKSGVWSMLHEARTDVSMLLGLIFLALVGGGSIAVDEMRRLRPETNRQQNTGATK
jgi:putative oxidoreductase